MILALTQIRPTTEKGLDRVIEKQISFESLRQRAAYLLGDKQYGDTINMGHEDAPLWVEKTREGYLYTGKMSSNIRSLRILRARVRVELGQQLGILKSSTAHEILHLVARSCDSQEGLYFGPTRKVESHDSEKDWSFRPENGLNGDDKESPED